MALTIKNDEISSLVQELVALTGETKTAAVTTAVRERLDRVRNAQETSLADRLRAIAQDIAPGIAEPFRSIDHGDVLYNEKGLPR